MKKVHYIFHIILFIVFFEYHTLDLDDSCAIGSFTPQLILTLCDCQHPKVIKRSIFSLYIKIFLLYIS